MKLSLLFQKLLSYRSTTGNPSITSFSEYCSGFAEGHLPEYNQLNCSIEKSLNDKMMLVLLMPFQKYELIAQTCISGWEIRKGQIR